MAKYWDGGNQEFSRVGHFAAWAFSIVVPSDHVMPLPRVLVEAFVFFFFFLFSLFCMGFFFSLFFLFFSNNFLGGQVYYLVLGLIVRTSLHGTFVFSFFFFFS